MKRAPADTPPETGGPGPLGPNGLLWFGLGVTAAAFSYKGWLLIQAFTGSGTTGLSAFLAGVPSVPLPYVLLCVTVPFALIGLVRLLSD